MQGISENVRGILFILIANGMLILSDTTAKLATQDIAVSQLIVVRGLFATVVALAFCLHLGALPSGIAVRDRYFWLRIGAENVATIAYLSALANMDITAVTAIIQTVPIVVTAGASLMFGTRVALSRWVAISVGFCGVLIIVRPAMEGFTPWSLAALAAVLTIGLRDLCSRAMNPAIPPFAAVLTSVVFTIPTGLAMTQFEPWREMTAEAMTYCIISAMALPFGVAFMVSAMRHGEVAVVMPFRYSLLLWAIIVQLMVFGTSLDWPTMLGAAILTAAGLYTFWRRAPRREADQDLEEQSDNIKEA
jgi:drug/metabolite transporter (DMT)-like permease